MLPSELLTKRKFCINSKQNTDTCCQNVYDALSDFQDLYDDHENRISSFELLGQRAKTVKNPVNITINNNGQVTNIEEADIQEPQEPQGPQGPFTIIPVTTNTDFSIINPYTIVSVPQSPENTARMAAPPIINNWTGRWITRELFNGTVKFSFHVNNPKTYIGIVLNISRIASDMFKTNFKAGFFFQSATVFGVVDTNIRQDEHNSNICRIDRPWSSTDTFTIVYSAKLVQYFQNDEHIYTVNKKKKATICDIDIEEPLQKKQSVYIAGAFYTAQADPITVSQITIDEILPSTQPIMEYIENNTPQVLTSDPMSIASVLIHTDSAGKLSASANIVSSDITFLTLRVRGASLHADESTSITVNKYGNIIFGTTGVYPAGTYMVELSASGNATVMNVQLQAMAQLS
jgi:hypothetical protein